MLHWRWLIHKSVALIEWHWQRLSPMVLNGATLRLVTHQVLFLNNGILKFIQHVGYHRIITITSKLSQLLSTHKQLLIGVSTCWLLKVVLL